MSQDLKQALFGVFDAVQKNAIKLDFGADPEPGEAGQSRLGGRPDVPRDFEWPRFQHKDDDSADANRPLTFLAQVNLADATRYDTEGLLPTAGVLSFFYEMETQEWGFDPRDKGSARVFFFEDPATLRPASVPDDLDDWFPDGQAISYRNMVDLPAWLGFTELPEEVRRTNPLPVPLTDIEWEDYDAMREEYGAPSEGDDAVTTKLLGHPDVVQNPMEAECEMVTRGMADGAEGEEISQELRDDIEKASRDWTLLFQMGTDSGLEFGDVGHINYWIKKQDLARRDFDKAWLILQCG
ncbi:YwqG family protein [Propionibacterium freudenreichii]|uniref:YwqG family protein n=1 Tax=Propionibacterium freudenreichii TaxID=1744 RepID=UPI003852D9BE